MDAPDAVDHEHEQEAGGKHGRRDAGTDVRSV